MGRAARALAPVGQRVGTATPVLRGRTHETVAQAVGTRIARAVGRATRVAVRHGRPRAVGRRLDGPRARAGREAPTGRVRIGSVPDQLVPAVERAFPGEDGLRASAHGMKVATDVRAPRPAPREGARRTSGQATKVAIDAQELRPTPRVATVATALAGRTLTVHGPQVAAGMGPVTGAAEIVAARRMRGPVARVMDARRDRLAGLRASVHVRRTRGAPGLDVKGHERRSTGHLDRVCPQSQMSRPPQRDSTCANCHAECERSCAV